MVAFHGPLVQWPECRQVLATVLSPGQTCTTRTGCSAHIVAINPPAEADLATPTSTPGPPVAIPAAPGAAAAAASTNFGGTTANFVRSRQTEMPKFCQDAFGDDGAQHHRSSPLLVLRDTSFVLLHVPCNGQYAGCSASEFVEQPVPISRKRFSIWREMPKLFCSQ